MMKSMNHKISVIVPVYNMEQYLSRCVDGILQQTYSNLEIILVDDGSTDTSPKLCDEYATKDNRVKVIHKANGGLSSARNVGLEEATGDYLGFIDSDDYITTEMYSLLYKNIVTYQADISMCGMYLDTKPPVPFYSNPQLENSEGKTIILNDDEIIKCSLLEYGAEQRINPSVCNKLYKCDLFQKIRFPLHKYYEDFFVMLPLLQRAKRFVIDTSQHYYYYQRTGSIAHTPETYYDFIEANEMRYKIISEEYPQLEQAGKKRLIISYLDAADLIIQCESKEDIVPILQYIQSRIKLHGYHCCGLPDYQLDAIELLLSDIRNYELIVRFYAMKMKKQK